MQTLIKINQFESRTIRRTIRTDDEGREYVKHAGRTAYLEPEESMEARMDDGSARQVARTRIIDYWV